MEEIEKVMNLDYSTVIMGMFIILTAIISVYEIISKVCEIFNIPISWVKRKNHDHELIIENTKHINELAERHEKDEKKNQRHNSDIEKKLNKLTDMVLQKEINDARWTILDFSSALSNGRKYNKESFSHIFQIYEGYKKVLKENGMTNGYVDESMEFIRNKYKELLHNGDLN